MNNEKQTYSQIRFHLSILLFFLIIVIILVLLEYIDFLTRIKEFSITEFLKSYRNYDNFNY